MSVYRFTDHTLQYTTTTIKPEKAKLGHIITFLDLLEKDTRTVASSIARRSIRYGPSLHGEAYYLGMYDPPLDSYSRLALELTHRHRVVDVAAEDFIAVHRRVYRQPSFLWLEQRGARADDASQDEELLLSELANL